MTAEKKIYTFSRRSRNILAALVIFFIIALSLLDRVLINKTLQPEPDSVSKASDIEAFDSKTFEVINVVDGDTLDIDHPDRRYNNTRIRLIGVDTPETKKPDAPVMHFGRRAQRFTKRNLLNKRVTILLDPLSDTRDKYGRLLCYVIMADGTMFNQLLIKTGHGYADPRFEHSYYNKFRTLMEKARRSKAGLWESVETEDMPYYMN